MDAFLPSGGGINFSENGGCKITDYNPLEPGACRPWWTPCKEVQVKP